jgi:hypothetical protein
VSQEQSQPQPQPQPRIEVQWNHGERLVRWSHGGRTVEKQYDKAPQAVLAWDSHVLVVEALDYTPFTPSDNAVVFDADGSERVRLRPPQGLVSEPHWVFGFYAAHLDAAGLPIVVIATQVGDFWGRPDLDAGTLTDVREWR